MEWFYPAMANYCRIFDSECPQTNVDEDNAKRDANSDASRRDDGAGVNKEHPGTNADKEKF